MILVEMVAELDSGLFNSNNMLEQDKTATGTGSDLKVHKIVYIWVDL